MQRQAAGHRQKVIQAITRRVKQLVSSKRTPLIVAVLVFGILGSWLLVVTHATTPTASQEAEAGTLSGAATTLSDSSASGGKAVQFGSGWISVDSYGAKGDGVTDDTAALNKAFSTAPAGSTLYFAPGKTYLHNNSLNVTVSGLHITGAATVLATNESDSALQIKAPNVTIDGGTLYKFNTAGATRQSAGWQSMIYVYETTGTTISNITVNGSPSIGILFFGSSGYTVNGVTVENTLADSFHSTYGSHDGVIENSTSQNGGDDGFANVSYLGDGAQVYNMTYTNDKLLGQTHGRAFSVVGGHDITFTNCSADSSDGASLYIAAEGPNSFNTYGVANVKVDGMTITNANTDSNVSHGAILFNESQTSYSLSNIDLENITVSNTRSTAPWQVGLLNYSGGGISKVTMRNFTVTGGPSNLLSLLSVAGSDYNTVSWTFNGTQQADHIGYTPYP